ncbi:MAG: hypothetical protein CMI98_03415 [Pelagibacteraceae bacterium]|nr:hypothetical protein [Pelagibacteraceae bacterium]
MKKTNNNIDIFKKTLSIVTKTISKKKKVEIAFSSEENDFDTKNINIRESSAILSKKDISEVRGNADSLGSQLRFHNSEIHKKFTNKESSSYKIFNNIEKARCESLGSNYLKGIKINITNNIKNKLKKSNNQNIKIEDLLYIHSFLNFTKNNSDKDLIHFQKKIDNKLIKKMEPYFKDLSKNLQNQKVFAEKIYNMLDDLGFDLSINNDENINDQKNEDDNLSENDNQKNPEKDKGDDQSEDVSQDSSDKSIVDGDEKGEGDQGEDYEGSYQSSKLESLTKYKAYTREFDEIIEANKLCDFQELEKLRSSLDKQVFSFQPLIAKLANRLQRKLLSQQNRNWEFNLEEGYLDNSKLAKFIANPSNVLTFKKEKTTEFKDTVVTLLIDNSGSMRGRPITVAALCSDIIARTLERCLIKVEILGFTSSAWKGGKSREKWINNNKPSNPGRLNDLRHIIYKNADSPWRRSKKNLGLLLKEGILKENIDGEALLWAHNRLLVRNEKRKILMVISDGAPVDDSTLSANPGNYLERNLREVIDNIEKRNSVELLAIGIGHDVSRYYNNAATINDVDQLGEVLLNELSNIFSNTKKKLKIAI